MPNKGGFVISESFSLWLKSPNKGANRDLSQNKQLFEIKPPLEPWFIHLWQNSRDQ
jgi:hypothetical protein